MGRDLAMVVAIIIVTAVVIVAGAALLWRQGNPEQTATHGGPSPSEGTTSDSFYAGVDRPAGPDAEDPRIEDDGGLA